LRDLLGAEPVRPGIGQRFQNAQVAQRQGGVK
jgi:hypothetical protein